jgi:hypothetical protein
MFVHVWHEPLLQDLSDVGASGKSHLDVVQWRTDLANQVWYARPPSWFPVTSQSSNYAVGAKDVYVAGHERRGAPAVPGRERDGHHGLRPDHHQPHVGRLLARRAGSVGEGQMASWRFAIGNLVSRAAGDLQAVAPAVEDTNLPLANLGSGYPDEQGGLEWRSDGTYDVDLDLNLLAASSERADAPTGWTDLLLYLAGTPGLPANPPDWGTYGGRTALRLFRPVFQDVDVMPGEELKITGALYRPSGATGATGIEVRILDLTTGYQYDASAPAWDADGQIEGQTTADTWLDFAVTVPADTSHTERRTYRVVVSPQAATYDSTSYVYISTKGGSGSPALFAEVDLVAFIGHNLPATAMVELQPQPSGTAIAIALAQPSCYAVATSAALVQTWRLSIEIPTALRPSAPRPIIGELWIGSVRTLLGKAPVLPISLNEGDPNQARIETLGGRIEVLGTGVPPRASMLLNFTFDTASYEQARDQVARLTRNGEEPLLLLTSDSFEGAGRIYHGRLGSTVAYSRISPDEEDALRSFGWAFEESPLPAT